MTPAPPTHRYHVLATDSVDGSPDIDERMDVVPADIRSRYAYVSVSMLVPISLLHLKEALKS